MRDFNEVFGTCRALYDDSYNVIRAMAKSMAAIYESHGKPYEPENLITKFELIMQYSLFQVAVNDRSFDRTELVFIHGITKKADLVGYLNFVYHYTLTWEDFIEDNAVNLKGRLENLYPQMFEVSREFISVFSFFDHHVEDDLLSELEQNVAAIIFGLSAMDGYVSNAELDKPILILDVIEKIRELLAKGN